MTSPAHSPLQDVYRRLWAAYGPQDWWPGDMPFEIMAGAVLTQNTAWVNVERAIANLRANQALDPHTILATHPRRLGTWLRPSGYFNVKARRLRNFCRWYVEMGGYAPLSAWETPRLREALLTVNGVGRETADAILLYAFHRPVFVVDAYARRIFSRLGLVTADIGYEPLRARFEQELAGALEPVRLFNEYHALIVSHGKAVCRPRPHCDGCCLRAQCAAASELSSPRAAGAARAG